MKIISITLICLLLVTGCNNGNKKKSELTNVDNAFTNDLKHRTFKYFWDTVDTATWQTPDRYPTKNFTSVAATGFGLTTYIVGVNNNYITREEAAERVLKTLTWLKNSKQGSETSGVTGYKGFYYHFLSYNDGFRFKNVELSTIDTAWLIAGILSCQTFFDKDNEQEQQIREIADFLYRRVEWDWAMNGHEVMTMGWHPESGFIKAKYSGYSEAMMLYILGLASPTHPIPDSTWNAWCRTYIWKDFYGYKYINFEPLFGHQYSHMYIDFRRIQDDFTKDKGIDYFENSRRATLANRNYCIENPQNFIAYSDSIWGLTACDGPADTVIIVNGNKVQFYSYRARGASVRYIEDDGTIAPTAAGGSIPFAPQECIAALKAMKNTYGENIYGEYGFKDAFNPTFISPKTPNGWFDNDYLGIDQGPILIQLENYQTELIWNLMKKNKYIVTGLKKAGFKGGWLDSAE